MKARLMVWEQVGETGRWLGTDHLTVKATDHLTVRCSATWSSH